MLDRRIVRQRHCRQSTPAALGLFPGFVAIERASSREPCPASSSAASLVADDPAISWRSLPTQIRPLPGSLWEGGCPRLGCVRSCSLAGRRRSAPLFFSPFKLGFASGAGWPCVGCAALGTSGVGHRVTRASARSVRGARPRGRTAPLVASPTRWRAGPRHHSSGVEGSDDQQRRRT